MSKKCQPSYYIDQSKKFDHDGGSVNFDHPEALDFDLLAKQLEQIKSGKPINVPVYDFSSHTRLDKTELYGPKKVIIVDGILILGQPKVRKFFDHAIFVHTPEEIRFQRRLSRDVNERGRTPEGIKNQFELQVKPMHDKFVEPSKQYADTVSSGTDMETFNNLLNKILEQVKKL